MTKESDIEEFGREFTEEELSRDITFERIRDYHYSVGEDFVDQNESIGDARILLGFIIAKSPELTSGLIELANSKVGKPWPYCLTVQDILGYLDCEGDSEAGHNAFYTLYADFANHTVKMKAEINKILISTEEHYNTTP